MGQPVIDGVVTSAPEAPTNTVMDGADGSGPRPRRRCRRGQDTTQEEKDKLHARGADATEAERAHVYATQRMYTELMQSLESHPFLDFLQPHQLLSDLARHHRTLSAMTNHYMAATQSPLAPTTEAVQLTQTHVLSHSAQRSTVNPVPPLEPEKAATSDNDITASGPASFVYPYLVQRGLEWLWTQTEEYINSFVSDDYKACDVNYLDSMLHVLFCLKRNGLFLYPHKVSSSTKKDSPTPPHQIHQ